MGDENKDVEYDDDLDAEIPNVYWTLKIPVGEEAEIPQPPIEGYIVKVTSATFGEKVKENSRTVVKCTQIDSDQNEITNPICILRENTQETVQLDLLFSEMVIFSISGTNPSEVTLNGYLQPPYDNNLDNIDGELDESKLNELMSRKRKHEDIDNENDNENENENEINNNIDDNDDEEDNNDDIDDDEPTKDGSQDNSNDNDNDNENDNEDEENSNDKEIENETPKEPAIKKRKLNEHNKVEKKNKNKKDNKKNKKMIKLKNGIQYYDMRVGSGKTIKNGNKVTVRYVGQLEDKTVFDKAITGQGFEFTFGKGEVVKGWDIGLKNIKVGGKRRLIIPPKFGYGKDGSEPSIPPNSTLTFTIEVMKIEEK